MKLNLKQVLFGLKPVNVTDFNKQKLRAILQALIKLGTKQKTHTHVWQQMRADEINRIDFALYTYLTTPLAQSGNKRKISFNVWRKEKESVD